MCTSRESVGRWVGGRANKAEAEAAEAEEEAGKRGRKRGRGPEEATIAKAPIMVLPERERGERKGEWRQSDKVGGRSQP